MPVLDFPSALIEGQVTEGATRYTRRLDVYEFDGVTLWERDVPIVSGSVTADQTRPERRSASLVLHNEDGKLQPDRDGGFWYDKILKLYMGIQAPSEYWETCIGVFLIDKMSTGSNDFTIGLSLRDKSKILKQELPYTLTYPENMPVENIIDDLAGEGGIGESDRNVLLDPQGNPWNIPIQSEVTLERGSDRYAKMNEIANIYGLELWFDSDGVLQMGWFEDPTLDSPQYTFQTGTLSNLSKVDKSISDTLIRNHIVVYGEQVSGSDTTKAPIWGEALNNNPDSPTNVNRLGLRTETYKSELITSFNQAEALAYYLLQYRALEQYDCNLSTVIVPWLEPGIIVTLLDPHALGGDPIRFLLSSITLNLDLSPASAVVKRITNIENQSLYYPDTDEYPDTTEDSYPSSGTGKTVWRRQVLRSWIASDLVYNSPTWWPSQGSFYLSIGLPGSYFTLTQSSQGLPLVDMPGDAFLEEAQHMLRQMRQGFMLRLSAHCCRI